MDKYINDLIDLREEILEETQDISFSQLASTRPVEAIADAVRLSHAIDLIMQGRPESALKHLGKLESHFNAVAKINRVELGDLLSASKVTKILMGAEILEQRKKSFAAKAEAGERKASLLREVQDCIRETAKSCPHRQAAGKPSP